MSYMVILHYDGRKKVIKVSDCNSKREAFDKVEAQYPKLIINCDELRILRITDMF